MGAYWKSARLLTLIAVASPVAAAESDIPALHGSGLRWLDWVVVVVYLGGLIALGSYFAKRQSTNSDYFIAARRHINPVLVGISLFAALLSTISYLGKPGEMINKGPMILVGQVLAVPIAYAVVGYWLIPRIMQERVTSAYELLEHKLGLPGRLIGAVLFLNLRLIWMGLLIYLAAVALAVIINVDLKWVPLVAVVVGLVPLIYSSAGGLRAVVVADTAQFILLLFGALLTIAIVTVRCGGFSWWPTTWSPYWDSQPVLSLDPHVRATLVGAVLNAAVWRICTAGGDQMAIQRYMATRDISAAKKSYLVNCCATVLVTIVLAVLGLALLGFFTRFPELLKSGLNVRTNGDHLFPYFIANLLPVGISGLVIAAILAAASNVDSGVNAVTAVLMRDFVERFGWKPASEQRRLRTTRLVAFGIGLLVVAASMVMHKVPGNFMEMTNKTAALEAAPIFGLFFLALFVPCATPLGAVVGTAYGLSTAILVAFWDVLTGRTPISFQYIGAIALIVNIGIGWAVSRFGPPRDDVRRSRMVGAILLFLLAIGIAVLITV